MTSVVGPLAKIPIEEFDTLKFPSVPVEIIKGVLLAFPFNVNSTEMDVVKIWKLLRVGGAEVVFVEEVTVVAVLRKP